MTTGWVGDVLKMLLRVDDDISRDYGFFFIVVIKIRLILELNKTKEGVVRGCYRIFTANLAWERPKLLQHSCYKLIMRELVRHLTVACCHLLVAGSVASQMFILITPLYFFKKKNPHNLTLRLTCFRHPSLILNPVQPNQS